MSFEREWEFVSQPLSSDGQTSGLISVPDTKNFFVRQNVTLSSGARPSLNLQVKLVIGRHIIYLGSQDKDLSDRTDVSAYLVSDGATVTAFKQKKTIVKPPDQEQATYEGEPVNGRRVAIVDPYGEKIDSVVDANGKNRLAVDANLDVSSLEIGTVDQGRPNTPANAWPVEVYGTNGNSIEPNADGSVNVAGEGVTSPTIFNIPVATAATEISQSLPSNTKKFFMKVRDGMAKIQVAFLATQSGTDFITIDRGCVYVEDNIKAPSLTVYFQLDKPGKTVEILTWV